MANKDTPNGFKAVMNLGGGAIPMLPGMTKANIALSPGDAVIMLSDGTIDIALATSALILGVCQSKVTAESAVSKAITYVPALDNIVFSGQCSGTYTPVNAGELVDIEGATGVMEINEDAQSVNVARIIGLDQHVDNAAGANARVLFTWSKSQTR